MSALVAITDTAALVDGAIIGTAIVAILAIGTWLTRNDEKHWNQPILVPEDLPILDHARCVHVDADGVRCTTVLCFCTTLHPVTGQPVTCPDADRPACFHSLVSRATTGGHCTTHQRSCPDCITEDASLWGHVS